MDTEFAGEFETHITVNLQDLAEIPRLQQWGATRNLKFLHILLEGGSHISQPMLTRRGYGNLTSELQMAKNLEIDLNRANFSVSRIKIEAAPWNQDIPQSDRSASTQAHRYFEHHIKLSLESTTDILPLKELTHQHSAHISRNALKIRADGYRERFVTQRCIGVGQIEAQNRLRILVESIESLGYVPIDIEAEFVVYDSNLALDAL
jgi:hypothetical protein